MSRVLIHFGLSSTTVMTKKVPVMPRRVSCTEPSWAWPAVPSSKLSMTGYGGSAAPLVR
jgi:hypothetical protein